MTGARPEPTVDEVASADDLTGRDAAGAANPDPNPDGLAPEGSLPASDPMWRQILEGTTPGFAAGHRFFRKIPSSPRCKLCAAPFGGIGAPVMQLFDRGPWDKNPSICGFCFKQLERGHGGAEIDLTLLFADIRGSTSLAESMEPRAFQQLIGRFYRASTEVLIAHDAIIDKFVGDEVVALFIPALTGPEHARHAVDAAREMLRATGHRDRGGPWVPVGIGIHSGNAYVGTVGDTVTDFTALGDAVNVTARLASEAAGGEILVSADASARAELAGEGLETRRLTLRGRQQPLDVQVLRV
jgi:adenylate cyclase